MRYREPFTIFPRKLKSGKTVYYYRTYAPNGRRTVAHSTGKTNKAQARCYCAELLRNGLLCVDASVRFSFYAEGFFDDNSKWMSDKIQAGQGRAQPVAENTLKMYRMCLNNYLLPFFGKKKLSDIEPHDIKEFRNYLIEKDFSNTSINLYCGCLKIILSYALAEKLITFNPGSHIQSMYVSARKKDAFTFDELKNTFSQKWNNRTRKAYALTAALTGMRMCEILAIRKETLFREYIEVNDQFVDGKYCPVKDGEGRKVRICNTLYELLSSLITKKHKNIFPESKYLYRSEFYNNCSVKEDDRKKRGLTFHSLRHFFNTYLVLNNINEMKIKSVMGHSSGKSSMTERYTNFKPSDFDEIAVIQEKLLAEFSVSDSLRSSS